MIVTFAGNRIDTADRPVPRFPPSNVDAVGRRVATHLKSQEPELVVGAAASGADLIVLGEARRLAIPSHIVLPLPTEEFRARSVEDQGDHWAGLFDEAVSEAEGLSVQDLSRYDDWYLRGNEVILSVAEELAAGRSISGLVIAGPGDESASSDFRTRVVQRGWPCLTIDPARPDPDELP